MTKPHIKTPDLAKALAAGTLASWVLVLPAWAGSFAINENSANDLGRANAGRVVSDMDAIAAWGNPAMMVAQDRALLTSTISYIDGTAEFTNTGSTNALGAPVGGDVDDFFDNAFVPSLQGIYPVNDRLALGLSVNAPFGLASVYEPDTVARYQAIESELFTLNVNPSVGFEVTDRLSVGAGFNVQYADVTLTNAIDFGTIALVSNPAVTDPAVAQSDDGLVELMGDDISFGYNVGAAFHASDALTFGVHYRSDIDHVIEGEAAFTLGSVFGPAVAAATGAFQDTGAVAELDLPASL